MTSVLLAADPLGDAPGAFDTEADAFARAVVFRAVAFAGLAFRAAGGVGDGPVAVAAVPWTFVSEPDPVDPVDVSSAIASLLWCAGHCPPRHPRRRTEPC
jgi:hypothetical protein